MVRACHRTSTPHKSGNKMMRRKNNGQIQTVIFVVASTPGDVGVSV